MFSFKYFVWFGLVVWVGSFVRLVQSDELFLDSSLKQLAVNLFKEFSNKTRLDELMKNNGQEGALNNLPDSSLSVIYRNYTFEQLKALENELNRHSHRIYEPIKTKAEEAGHRFLVACKSYDKDRDLKELENSFLETGETLVSLQKLVLRIINSKLVDKLNSKSRVVSFRQGRPASNGWFNNVFEQLSKMFFGLSFYKTSTDSPVNKLLALIQQLESIESIQPTTNDQTTNQNIVNLKRLLDRLRKIQQLNQIASVPNHYLNTEFISPYSYEATLKLVSLLGTGAFYNANSNPIVNQFRSWANFFSGGNILTALMNPFNGGTTTNRPAKYDAEKLKKLIALLEENERIRQKQIERNRQKIELDKLMNNQNKQQQQINSILGILTNNTNVNSNNNQQTITSRPWTVTTQTSTRYPFGGGGGGSNDPWPSASANQKNILQQLKDQRKHLNELLVELQKPYSSVTSNTPPSWPIQYPPASTGTSMGGGLNNGNRPSSQNIAQAQKQLMQIMRNITPIINVMAQSGMVSMPRIQNSKIDLLDIINSVNNNRELDDTADADKEMIRVEKLGEKLETVLDGIIEEAETKIKN